MPHVFWRVVTKAGTRTMHTIAMNAGTMSAPALTAMTATIELTGIPILAPVAAGAAGIAGLNLMPCLSGALGAMRRGFIGF